jgi:transposase-like protein
MYLFGNRWVQKYADCAADRFRTDRRSVREILFVDETLLQIDGGQN